MGDKQGQLLLREDIVAGAVTKGMKPKEVYSMRPCYADFSYENFWANLRAMRLAVEKDLARAEQDKAYYLHDKLLFGTKRTWRQVNVKE